MSSLIVSAIFLAFVLVPGFDGATPDSTCEGKKKNSPFMDFFSKKKFRLFAINKGSLGNEF